MRPALKGRPETKSILFPVWRDEHSYFLNIPKIVGMFANWAIRQSPYDVPDNLEDACDRLTVKLQKTGMFKKESGREEWGNITGYDLEKLLLSVIEDIPEIRDWEIKKKENVPIDHSDPDTDFISLNALVRNTVHSIQLEQLYYQEEVKS